MSPRRRRTGGSNDWLVVLSFWAVLLIGLSFFLRWLLGFIGVFAALASIAYIIGIAIAVFIPIVLSYRYARSAGRGWFVVWVIAVVIVVVFMILGQMGAFGIFSGCD